MKRQAASAAIIVMAAGVAALALAAPGGAQNYQQPPPAVGGPPILMQQAPPDPRQFCYYNGQPFSMGSPYPSTTPGPNGRQMHCRATPGMVNGYIMMEWSDEN